MYIPFTVIVSLLMLGGAFGYMTPKDVQFYVVKVKVQLSLCLTKHHTMKM